MAQYFVGIPVNRSCRICKIAVSPVLRIYIMTVCKPEGGLCPRPRSIDSVQKARKLCRKVVITEANQ